ncbi:MAG: transposase [Armatimonadetes bacterium]|nr:transposase [Armatimonadota bacterium]
MTDEQWAKMKPLLPTPPERPKGGRPRCDDRLVLKGIL